MINLTNENYEKEVVQYKGKVIIDCWANWCGRCKMIKPKFEELAKQNTEFKFCSLDVDKANEIASKLNIMNLPTFIIYENGKEVNRGSFEVLNTL